MTDEKYHKGTVKWYKRAKRMGKRGGMMHGFGYIIPDDGSPEVKVERRAIVGNEGPFDEKEQVGLDTGQMVLYTLIEGSEVPKARSCELYNG